MRDNSITKMADATPSDTVNEAEPGIGILVGVAGIVKVTLLDGDEGQVYLVAGVWHPMQVKRVWSTGTDAAVLAGLIKMGW